jgi:hypothetical protein
VENAATKPVDGPDHQNIEPAADDILEHLVGGRSLIPTFPLVFVGLDDYPATLFCDLTRTSRWFSVVWSSRLTRR